MNTPPTLPRPFLVGWVTRIFGGVAFALGLVTIVGTAHAYEDRWTVGPELGGGAILVDDTTTSPVGPWVGLNTSVGLNDIWTLRLRGAYGIHPGDETMHLGVAAAEFVYSVDIVEWVPFAGLGTGVFVSALEGEVSSELGFNFVMGLDYFLSRDVLFGVDLRQYFLPVSFGAADRLSPAYSSLSVRLSFLFDS